MRIVGLTGSVQLNGQKGKVIAWVEHKKRWRVQVDGGREVTIRHVPVDEMFEKYGEAISKRGLYFLATHMCYDINKARDQLGYQPTHTTEEAIEETARWASASVGD